MMKASKTTFLSSSTSISFEEDDGMPFIISTQWSLHDQDDNDCYKTSSNSRKQEAKMINHHIHKEKQPSGILLSPRSMLSLFWDIANRLYISIQYHHHYYHHHTRSDCNPTSSSGQRRQQQQYLMNDKLHHILRQLFILFTVIIVIVVTIHRTLAFHMTHRKLIPAPITYIDRTCPIINDNTYITMTQEAQQHQQQLLHKESREQTWTRATTFITNDTLKTKPKICITTLTDEYNKSLWMKYFGWRNFDGLLRLSWENKYRYAKKHGYYLYDESTVSLDTSRPPSWSKIKAVRRLLIDENCTWVFWLDADTIIMNSNKKLEDFLPSSDSKYDLILSADKKKAPGSYNAGAWMIRNTKWSIEFLNTWWDMKSFVMPPGFSKSGDNDALKELLGVGSDRNHHGMSIQTISETRRDNTTRNFRHDENGIKKTPHNSFRSSHSTPSLPKEVQAIPSDSSISGTRRSTGKESWQVWKDTFVFDDHCYVPPQCTFNSFTIFMTASEYESNYLHQRSKNDHVDDDNQQSLPSSLNKYDWFMAEYAYHKGDFIAHMAGVDNKYEGMQQLLNYAS